MSPSVDPSNTSPLPNRERPQRCARTLVRGSLVLAVGALVVVVAIVASVLSALRGMDDKRFDEIETGFEEHRTAFEAAVDRMAGWAAERPDAVRIGWTQSLVCVTDTGRAKQCTDTSMQERAAFRQLAGATRAVWQAKDDGRVFFAFNVQNPPIQYLMFDPDDRDPRAYAAAQGFRWGRSIGDGWSLLGEIPDVEKQSSMWMD